MSVFTRILGSKYDDEKLLSIAKVAIAEDPLLPDVTGIALKSEHGVVSLSGVVHRDSEKVRVEKAVRQALETTGLRFDHIVNELKAS